MAPVLESRPGRAGDVGDLRTTHPPNPRPLQKASRPRGRADRSRAPGGLGPRHRRRPPRHGRDAVGRRGVGGRGRCGAEVSGCSVSEHTGTRQAGRLRHRVRTPGRGRAPSRRDRPGRRSPRLLGPLTRVAAPARRSGAARAPGRSVSAGRGVSTGVASAMAWGSSGEPGRASIDTLFRNKNIVTIRHATAAGHGGPTTVSGGARTSRRSAAQRQRWPVR